MSANIKDVAKKACVSITTVSRVLNNHPNVSEKTKTTVNNVMQELNYYPHQIARAEAFKLTCMENNVPYKIIELEHTKLTYDYFYSFIEERVSPVLQGIDGVFCSNDLLANALWDGLLQLIENPKTHNVHNKVVSVHLVEGDTTNTHPLQS